MHWLDRAAAIAARNTPLPKRPFNEGWGDEAVVQWYLDNSRSVPPIADIEVSLRPARRAGKRIIRDLSFESPYDMLPDGVRTVRARWLTADPEPDRLVVIHAGWNDEDYTTRTRFARDLLDEGIASILIQHPLYGDRRRDPGSGTPCPTVADFCLMGRGGVLEGRSLLRWLRGRGYRLGVAGYSMGGNIAGFVGSLVDFPVAISPIAATYAAGPAFLSGLLRDTIAWDALGGENEETEGRLSRVLFAGSLLDHDPPPHTATAVLLAGTVDGFVPTSCVQAIHRHWPGSTMDWVRAGHASLLYRRRDRIVAAIKLSFDKLDRFAPAGAGQVDAID